MLGYNILTLRQNKETDIDDYDIVLIKLCKMFRINIKHQQFFADHIIDSVKIPYHPHNYSEKLLIDDLYRRPSTKRNHHLIFFQYLVRLLCQKRKSQVEESILLSILVLICLLNIAENIFKS